MTNKLIPIPYCVFIMKPHVVINEEKVPCARGNRIEEPSAGPAEQE